MSFKLEHFVVLEEDFLKHVIKTIIELDDDFIVKKLGWRKNRCHVLY